MTRPTASPAIWPYPHRTMAEVMMAERIDASHRAMLGNSYPAPGSPDPSIQARATGRRGEDAPYSSPPAALSTHVHDSEVHRG